VRLRHRNAHRFGRRPAVRAVFGLLLVRWPGCWPENAYASWPGIVVARGPCGATTPRPRRPARWEDALGGRAARRARPVSRGTSPGRSTGRAGTSPAVGLGTPATAVVLMRRSRAAWLGGPGSPRGQPAAREAGAASDGRSRDAGPGSAAVLGSSDTTATTALLPTFLIPARRVGAKVGALERETAADDDLADDQARGQPSCRHLHRPPGRRRPPRRAVQLEALDGADRTLAFSPVVPEPWLGPGQERPVEHALVARQRVGGEVLRVPVGWGTGLGVVRRRP